MKNLIYSPQPDDKIGELRLIVRSLLLLALLTGILYIRVFVIATLSTLEANGQGGLGLLSLAFLIAAIVGLLLAWRWEGLGGMIIAASGIGLAVLTFLTTAETPWLTAFFYGSPFVITGFVCLVYWRKGRNRLPS